MAYLTAGLGEARVKWAGGKAGDVNEDGISYGTPESEAAAIIAARTAAREALLAQYATPAATPASVALAPASVQAVPAESNEKAVYVVGGAVLAVLGLAYFMTRGRR